MCGFPRSSLPRHDESLPFRRRPRPAIQASGGRPADGGGGPRGEEGGPLFDSRETGGRHVAGPVFYFSLLLVRYIVSYCEEDGHHRRRERVISRSRPSEKSIKKFYFAVVEDREQTYPFSTRERGTQTSSHRILHGGSREDSSAPMPSKSA